MAASESSGIIPQPIDLQSKFPEIPRGAYLTHRFDSYPAKMIPHMARFLINEVSRPGQTVLDPFCGTAAVVVESLTSGRNAIGVDLNPLAVLFARAKTMDCNIDCLEGQLEELRQAFNRCGRPHRYDFPNADYWFTSGTLRKLGTIKACLDKYLANLEPEFKFFWRAVAAAIVRECSRADTRGPKPFISKKARKERVGRHFDPFKLFESKARSWIAGVQYELNTTQNGNRPWVKLIEGDSRMLSKLLGGTIVDAVVTSPPYPNAQDYYRSSKLQLFTLGLRTEPDLKEWSRTLIGSDRILTKEFREVDELPCPLAETVKRQLAKRNKKGAYVFVKYVLDMAAVLREIRAVLRKRSYCAIVSGYNLLSGIIIPTPEVISELASNEGFNLTRHYIDRIRDRWVPTNRNGHNGVINEEHLMVFQTKA